MKEKYIHYKKSKKASLKRDYDLLIFLDTETTTDNKIIYDLSYLTFSTKRGAIMNKASFLILDTWNTKSLRYGKYLSKEKRKSYNQMIKQKKIQCTSKEELFSHLIDLINQYGTKKVLIVAYNTLFDLEAMYNTFSLHILRSKYFNNNCLMPNTKSRPNFLMCDYLDLWHYASPIFESKLYKKWYDLHLKEFGLTKSGNRKTNCEILYRFLVDNAFIKETHIAQDDLEMEYQIFIAIYWKRGNSKIRVNYSGLYGAWKLAQNNCKLSKERKKELLLR